MFPQFPSIFLPIVLSCILLLTNSCTKCSGTATMGKAEYIAKLDAICAQANADGERLGKEWAAELLAKDPNISSDEMRPILMRQGIELGNEVLKKMESVAIPNEVVSEMKAFWDSQKRVLTNTKSLLDLQDEVTALALGQESEDNESSPPKENGDSALAKLQDAQAKIASIQKDLPGEAQKLAATAQAMGFKVCFVPPEN